SKDTLIGVPPRRGSSRAEVSYLSSCNLYLRIIQTSAARKYPPPPVRSRQRSEGGRMGARALVRQILVAVLVALAGCGGSGGGHGGGRGNTASPAPLVTSFSPATFTVGSTVIITGSGFSSASSVMFNGTAASSFAVVSDTQVTAIAPPGATSGTIVVTGPGGSGASSTTFHVIATVAGVSPNAAPSGGLVTIAGTGFTGATAVTFGGA